MEVKNSTILTCFYIWVKNRIFVLGAVTALKSKYILALDLNLDLAYKDGKRLYKNNSLDIRIIYFYRANYICFLVLVSFFSLKIIGFFFKTFFVCFQFDVLEIFSRSVKTFIFYFVRLLTFRR